MSINVQNIRQSHKNHHECNKKKLAEELPAEGQNLAEVTIQRGIFQGHSHFSLQNIM